VLFWLPKFIFFIPFFPSSCIVDDGVDNPKLLVAEKAKVEFTEQAANRILDVLLSHVYQSRS
jgi:hypothetical protein